MKRSIRASCRIAAVTALVVVGALAGALPAGAAPATQCTGVLPPGTYGTVIVPSGFCDIEGSTITGDVIVRRGAGVNLQNDVVGGSVLAADGPTGVGVCCSTVRHDVLIVGSTGFTQAYGDQIGGDVAILGTQGPFAGANDSQIHGNVLFVGNDPSGYNDISGDTIDGNVSYIDNHPGAPLNGLEGNTIARNLVCLLNTPPPTEAGTTVGGRQVGQCPVP